MHFHESRMKSFVLCIQISLPMDPIDRRQSVTWTKAGSVQWRIYAAPGGNGLINYSWVCVASHSIDYVWYGRLGSELCNAISVPQYWGCLGLSFTYGCLGLRWFIHLKNTSFFACFMILSLALVMLVHVWGYSSYWLIFHVLIDRKIINK